MSLIADWFATRKRTPEEIYQDKLDKMRKDDVKKTVDDMSWGDQMMVAAGHETDKLWAGSGAADLYDHITNDHKAIANRPADQAEKDKAYEPFAENADISAQTVGSSIPYLVTGYFGTPITKGIAKLAGQAAKGAAGLIGRSVVSAGGGATQAMIDAGGVPKVIGEKLVSDFAPMARTISHLQKTATLPDPWYGGAISRIVGDTLLGGIEGSSYYDNSETPDQHTFATGALASGAGSIVGGLLRPIVQRAPILDKDGVHDVVVEMYGKGAPTTKGMWTGNPPDQKFEANMRGDSGFAGIMKFYDRIYDKWRNGAVGELMGIDPAVLKDSETLTPKILKDHLTKIGKEYNDAYSAAVGQVDPNVVHNLRWQIADLRANPAPEVQAIGDKLDKKFLNFESFTMQGNVPKQYSGSHLQAYREKLKSDISQAYDKKMPKPYIDGLQTMKKAVEDGVDDLVPGVTNELRDLDARYAITHTVMEHAMTPTGDTNFKRYLEHRMANDPKILLLGDESKANWRFQELDKIAKLEDIRFKHTKGGLFDEKTPLESSNMSLYEKMISHPGSMIPGIQRPYLAAYMNKAGWPHTTGLLNFSGKGLQDSGVYTHALNQGDQVYPWLYNHTTKPVLDFFNNDNNQEDSNYPGITAADEAASARQNEEVMKDWDNQRKERLKQMGITVEERNALDSYFK